MAPYSPKARICAHFQQLRILNPSAHIDNILSIRARKPLVVIAVECHDGGPGRTRMGRIPNASADVLTDFVLDNVARGSEVQTDAWKGYNDVGRYQFSHVITNLSESDDPAHVVMPEVHRVASLLKRWLLGTHQGAVSHQQLDYYLDEFIFRFNRRRSESALGSRFPYS